MASPSKPSREKSFMSLNTIISDVTERIQTRSEQTRKAYLDTMRAAAQDGPRRAHLSCGNQAHAYAAMGADKEALLAARSANIGIVTAYNDMLVLPDVRVGREAAANKILLCNRRIKLRNSC